jgi:hypothetical protein
MTTAVLQNFLLVETESLMKQRFTFLFLLTACGLTLHAQNAGLTGLGQDHHRAPTVIYDTDVTLMTRLRSWRWPQSIFSAVSICAP